MRRYLRSEKVKLPRVHRVTRNGKVYKYHRITRAELPSHVPEDHPVFTAAWAAQEAGQPKKLATLTTGTIGHGCGTYLGSGSFKELGKSYSATIRRHVDAIREQGGQAKISDLRANHIEDDLDPLTPAVARSRLRAWRKLCEFWRRKGWLAEDISRNVLGKKLPKSEGFIEWTWDDVQQFRQRFSLDTSERLALELLQWTGARSSDAVRLGPGMVDRAGFLVFNQVKTGAEAIVPWTSPALGLESERMDLLRLTRNQRQMVFLTTSYGKARSHKAFSQWFSHAATTAGLPNLSAHGLRKFRMNRLAESGATVLQMQAWVGHLTLDEVTHYTRKADRRAAFGKGEQSGNLVKHPSSFSN